MTKLVFVHGWGSGPFVWQDIVEHFNKDYDCHVVNLGFLGEENTNIPDKPFIGVGHSLGGLWLLKNHPDKMIGFISIASFNCFYKHTAAQILSKMEKNVVKNTATQIKDFWNHAGMKQPKNIINLKPLKLLDGLKSLSQWNAAIPDTLSITVLASHDDHIVPKKMTQDIWKNHDINWVENGGHMLPLTQSQWCIDHIEKHIRHSLKNAA